ncbi:hypothetical protein KC345_g10968 [Hortaea werneckii]|nr:hypothetical protein KC345_g10968 [Hortaea werneckii]
MEIARTYGAAVHEVQWSNDFSAARNTGLSHASADWILVLDADEILQTSIEDIKDILQDTAAEAFTVLIENLLGNNPEDRLYHSNVRLFRNGQGYRFSGRIHESVDASILNTHEASAIRSSSIGIIHFGYLPSIMSAKSKINRNEELLRISLAEEPDDVFYSYNLAVTCCQDGRLEEAEDLLRHTLHHAPLQVSYRPSMIRDLCKIYLASGKVKALDSLLTRELTRYGDYPDLHYIQGQSWESQGLLERAYQSYQHAVDTSSATGPRRAYVTEQGMDSFRPLHRMGVISQQLGKPEEAARLFHRSLQHHSLYLPALLGIASAFQQLDVPDEDIAGLLKQLAGTEHAAARTAIIGTLYEIGAYQVIAELPPELFPLEADTLLFVLSSWMITGKFHAFRKTAAKLRSNTLQLASGALNPETLRQLWLLEAICTWELGGQLQQEQLIDAPAELRSGLLLMNEQLSSKVVIPQAVLTGSGCSPLIAEVIRLAVKLQLVSLGKTLADRFPANTADLAEVLYEEGWLAEAGELFIGLAGSKQARGQTLAYLGEMLTDNGHYAEAASWYRLSLEESPGNEGASAGLALCYLHLAEQGLGEVANSFKGEKIHGPLQEDMAAIAHSISVLNRTPWHTSWNYKQRQRGAGSGI